MSNLFFLSYPFRRCSSYQDFTQIGGSSESVDGPKSPSEEESPSQRRKHVSRTLSEPSQLVGGRMGRSHSEQRGRRSVHHRNRRLLCHPSARISHPTGHLRGMKTLRNQSHCFFPRFTKPLKQNTKPSWFKPKKSSWSDQGGRPSRW